MTGDRRGVRSGAWALLGALLLAGAGCGPATHTTTKPGSAPTTAPDGKHPDNKGKPGEPKPDRG